MAGEEGAARWDVKALVSHMIGTESFLAGIAPPSPISTSGAGACAQRHRSDERMLGAPSRQGSRHRGARAVPRGDRRSAQVLTSMSDDDWNAVTRHRWAWRAMGASCGYGCSTAGCTSKTSATRCSDRQPTTGSTGPRRDCPWMRSRRPWVSSSANSAKRPTVHGPVRTDRAAGPSHPRQRRRSRPGGRRLRRAGADGDDPAGWAAVHQARRRADRCVPRAQDVELGGDKDVGRARSSSTSIS